MIEQNRPPFFKLFTSLREQGLALGSDDYKLLLTALGSDDYKLLFTAIEGELGAADLEALSTLCKILWVKSDRDRRIFESAFLEVMRPEKMDAYPGDDPSGVGRWQDTHSTTSPPSEQAPAQAESSQDSPSDAERKEIQAILHREGSGRSFVRSDEYFPVTRRQMRQSWHYLRHPTRQGPVAELDIEQTVEQIGHLGFLFEPVFLPPYTNQAEVLLLIDQGGSMIPFHILSARLVESALHGGRQGKIGVYYFRNYPTDLLFRTPSLQDEISIKDVLNPLHPEHASALIFSDAGAARGHFSNRRYQSTILFLDQLSQHVRYQAWLNPMPQERWTDTTAQGIQQCIPMFDISQKGLERAINVLRGRSTL